MTASTYQEEYEYIQRLQSELPKFVSREHILNDILPAIALATAAVTIGFLASNYVVASVLQLRLSSHKAAYQLTNLFVNFALGIMGVYYFRLQSATPSVNEMVVGDYSLYPFGSIQIGYSLWAVIVGLLYVGESPAMIGHHVSVILVAISVLFFPLGYRYFAPFTCGVMEISSVPLAIMNAFKDNPEFIERYPAVYSATRWAFLFTFIYIRWWLYFPLKFDFLRLAGMGVLTYDSWAFAFYASLVWLSALNLCILQFWWGCIILKNLFKVLVKMIRSVSSDVKKKEL